MIIIQNETKNIYLTANSIINLTCDALCTGFYQQIHNGTVIKTVSLAARGLYTIGTYSEDFNFKIVCLTGSIAYAVSEFSDQELEYTWATKPTAAEFGIGQAWFSDIGAMGYSDGVNWRTEPPLTGPSIRTGIKDADTAIAATSLSPFTVSSAVTLDRVSGNVGTSQSTKLVEIGIYDSALNLLVTTERREVPEAGWFEFAHAPVTLPPGEYFYAVSCNGTSATFGHCTNMKGFTAALTLPLTATLAGLTPAISCPALTGSSSELPVPTMFADASIDNVRVYGKNLTGNQPWGLRTTNNKICFSTDSGATYTDVMAAPSLGTGNAIFDLLVYNSQVYILSSDLKVYQSSDLTAGATWTDISCPTTAGLRRATAVARPYGIAIFNDYVVIGEYSLTGADLQNDPTDPAPPRILKYGPLASSPTWAVTKQMTNARHIHSLFTENSSKLWASVGDATYGADVGVWRCTSITADTWTKWTSVSSPYTDHYPVDLVEINPGVGAPTGLYCTSDRPGKHLLFSKVTGTAGSFNLSQQLPRKNTVSTETVRSMVVAYNSHKNIYFCTQETTDPALFVSPPPYTRSYRLADFNPEIMTRSVISGNYLMIFNKRWRTPVFPGQV